MKRILLLLLVFCICFSCVSCNKKDGSSETQGGETQRHIVTLSCPEDPSVDGTQIEVGWRENYHFPVPTRENYIFDCWMNGDERLEASGVYPYSSNTTLVAKWLLKSYNISYNMSPHYDLASTSYTSESDDFKLPIPKKVSGYMFIGWSGTDLDGVNKVVAIKKGSTGDRSYTANWIKADEIENQLDGFVFEIVDDHAVVTGFCGELAKELTIPAEYKGYPVTTIGEGAFYGMGVFTGLLRIPYSVTVIEENAIGGCSGLPMSIYNGEFEDWKQFVVVGEGNGALNNW